MSTPPDWDNIVQSLDMELDTHQSDVTSVSLRKAWTTSDGVQDAGRVGKVGGSGHFQANSPDGDMAHAPDQPPRDISGNPKESKEGKAVKGGQDSLPNCTKSWWDDRMVRR